jgi:hypothetical protein
MFYLAHRPDTQAAACMMQLISCAILRLCSDNLGTLDYARPPVVLSYEQIMLMYCCSSTHTVAVAVAAGAAAGALQKWGESPSSSVTVKSLRALLRWCALSWGRRGSLTMALSKAVPQRGYLVILMHLKPLHPNTQHSLLWCRRPPASSHLHLWQLALLTAFLHTVWNVSTADASLHI